jgi:hypothetical protein
MTELARAIVIAAIVIGGALVVRGMFGTDRYELQAVPGGAVYRLDRLTGAMSYCTPVACRPLAVMVKVQRSGKQAPAATGKPAEKST